MKPKTFLKAAALTGITAAAAPLLNKKLNTPQGKKFMYAAADTAVNGVLSGVNAVLPDISRGDILDFTPDCTFAGTKNFLKTPMTNAAWSLGYSKASILPEDVTAQPYYLGGYPAYPPNAAVDVLDDQMIRCIALSDGSGRGIAVFAVIDCIGISNRDVNEIRAGLTGFAAENNIVSINICATHAHSCIDTLGAYGDPAAVLKNNPVKIIEGETDFVSGRNPAFMEHLKTTTVSLIQNAVLNMKPGKLYRAVQDGSKFLQAKRPPKVMPPEIVSLNFRPADGSMGTRAVFMSAQPAQFSPNSRTVSADYPYYLCEQIEQNGEHAIVFQGAALGIFPPRGNSDSLSTLSHAESIQLYGKTLGQYCLTAEFSEIAPILNLRHRKILVPVSNQFVTLLAKLQVVNNELISYGDKAAEVMLVSELGYAELGTDVKLALIPGEIAPELVIGGCADSADSYDGTAWDHASLQEIAGGKLTVIGLCNDEIASIIPDNDFGSKFAPHHYEEIISAGKYTASKIVTEFRAMLDTIAYAD
ncbi:MAG: hypothetical protein IJ766_05520 [Clostridia bacterium]|nr:hypothetical protein [Clostridia bacterium]